MCVRVTPNDHPVYVVTYERFTNRRRALLRQLEPRLWQDHSRFFFVDASEEARGSCHHNANLKIRRRSTIANTAITLSHLRALRHMGAAGHRGGYVLEDDVLLQPNASAGVHSRRWSSLQRSRAFLGAVAWTEILFMAQPSQQMAALTQASAFWRVLAPRLPGQCETYQWSGAWGCHFVK